MFDKPIIVANGKMTSATRSMCALGHGYHLLLARATFSHSRQMELQAGDDWRVVISPVRPLLFFTELDG